MKEWFYTITQFMLELGLRGTELNLFANLYGYSQRGDGCYYGTRKELAERCGVASIRTIDAALDSLIEKGLVFRLELEEHGVKFIAYTTRAKSAQGVQKLHTPPCKNCTPPRAKIAHPIKNKYNNVDITSPVPPSLAEVTAYCAARGFKDPEGFADYYISCQTAAAWRTKSGNPVDDWKRNIEEWRKNHLNDTFPRRTSAQPTGRKVSAEQLDKMLR